MSVKNYTYTLNIDAEIGNLVNKTKQVKESMANMFRSGSMPELEKVFGKIDAALTRLQEKASAPVTSASVFSSMEKDLSSVRVGLSTLLGDLKTFAGSSVDR
jgi:hypothetical protein